MKKKMTIGIVTLVVGLITLVAGVVFLVIKLNAKPATPDGEYLVSVNKWVLEDDNCKEDEEPAKCNSENVEWQFTEIGKGTLTTNNHLNDYDFVWTIDEDNLTIKTSWLYELDDNYKYSLDQGGGVLVLTDGDGTEFRFTAQQ